MGTWNYRVLYSKENEEDCFAVHEVYYNKEGKPYLYTESPSVVSSEKITGLNQVMRMFYEAMNKPVLDKNNFPEEYKT